MLPSKAKVLQSIVSPRNFDRAVGHAEVSPRMVASGRFKIHHYSPVCRCRRRAGSSIDSRGEPRGFAADCPASWESPYGPRAGVDVIDALHFSGGDGDGHAVADAGEGGA